MRGWPPCECLSVRSAHRARARVSPRSLRILCSSLHTALTHDHRAHPRNRTRTLWCASPHVHAWQLPVNAMRAASLATSLPHTRGPARYCGLRAFARLPCPQPADSSHAVSTSARTSAPVVKPFPSPVLHACQPTRSSEARVAAPYASPCTAPSPAARSLASALVIQLPPRSPACTVFAHAHRVRQLAPATGAPCTNCIRLRSPCAPTPIKIASAHSQPRLGHGYPHRPLTSCARRIRVACTPVPRH